LKKRSKKLLDVGLSLSTGVRHGTKVFWFFSSNRNILALSSHPEARPHFTHGFLILFRRAALAGYCALTALLFKRFWESGDFWSSGESRGRDLFWDFLKNLSLASGFLLIVVGLDGQAWHSFLADPLGSSHPYAAAVPQH